MAVAVKNSPETTTRFALESVALHSLLGGLYVLGSLALVFGVLPALWAATVSGPIAGSIGPFVDAALLILVMLAAAVGLSVLGQRLIGPSPAPGVKAGTFFTIVGLLAVGFATLIVGNILQVRLGPDSGLGLAITLAVGAGLLLLGFVGLVHPAYRKFLLQVEAQGWFSAAAYKRSQGQRVRRGTILGILVLAACGIYSLLAHHTLETGLSPHWLVALPFSGGRTLILLPDVQFTVPLLLAGASLWLAWRVVNFPTFADFLIATEAEMNKVSWTTRKRLVQDTVVVLTTVLLLTVFLFFVDVLWGWGLSKVGVLQLPEQTQQERQQAKW